MIYDAIIIGGGPAGATAGYILAKHFQSVLIIDKHSFPRKKLCGGMLSAKCLSLLKNIYHEEFQKNILLESYSRFSVHHPQYGELCTCMSESDKVYLVDRFHFDKMLIDAAIANGCHFMKAKVDSVSEGTVIISGQKNIEGKFIIGADGAIGVTRNSLGIKTDKREFSGSLETETNISNLKTHKNIPQIHFGHTPYGYGWVFPREDLAVIGIGGLTRKTSLPGAMSSLLDTVVSDKTLTGQIEGFPIPTHNFVKKPGRGRILLVGDAAGLIDPFTGEGIYAAALSGKIAAESILVGYNPAAEYNSTISKKLHSSIKHAKIVRRFFFHPKLFPLFMKKMHQKEEYGHHFFELLSGQLNYSDFARRIFTVRRAFLMMGILAKP